MSCVYKTHKQAIHHKNKEPRNHPTLNTAIGITVYKSIALEASTQLETGNTLIQRSVSGHGFYRISKT